MCVERGDAGKKGAVSAPGARVNKLTACREAPWSGHPGTLTPGQCSEPAGCKALVPAWTAACSE
jgi:hypothetical protein